MGKINGALRASDKKIQNEAWKKFWDNKLKLTDI